MTTYKKNDLILAIAPSSRGFGYVIVEGHTRLVDWGVTLVVGNKNKGSLKKVEKMITDYHPSALVLQDAFAKDSRRGSRIRRLTKEIVSLATSCDTKIELFSRDQVMRAFFIDGKGTKHTIAQVLAGRFPEELGHRLPPKRKPWKSEDSRMAMFEAVALAFTERLQKNR